MQAATDDGRSRILLSDGCASVVVEVYVQAGRKYYAEEEERVGQPATASLRHSNSKL